MYVFLTFVALALALALVVLLRYYNQRSPRRAPENELESLKTLDAKHDVHSAFMTLVNEDGAGEWPPKTDHDNFPVALQPYKEIYLTMAPSLATADPSLDDELNTRRCQEFRSRMLSLLSHHIDKKAVKEILETVARDNWDAFPRDAYNGFYSCIACLRHAYRWATNPVVRVAQNEKQLSFPPELDLPWSYIQRRFDITSPSGNIMANAVLNFDSQGRLVYLVNEGMSEMVLNTEYAWNRIFLDSESLGVPLYCAMIHATISFDQNDKTSALSHIEVALKHLRIVLQNLYEKMNNAHVARSIWVRHVSGIHSWGLIESNENPVEYGGLSGSQILTFLVLDGFLGIDRYHSDHEMKMHISKNMRDLCATFNKYSFRKKLSDAPEDLAIRGVMDRMVKQLRNFRAFHKVRAVRYLSAPAPERVPMTAALSVLQEHSVEKTQAKGPYEAIEGMLTKRLNETI